MIDLTGLKIEAENCSPSTSFNNLSKLRQVHGDIIAAIHCIDPSNYQSTQFIFFDGYTHESNGFSILTPKNDLEHHRLITLLLLIQSIPCLSPSSERIMQEYVEMKRDKSKSYYYVFRAGIAYMPKHNIYMSCDGMMTLNEILSFIFSDPDACVEESEQ